MKTIEVSKHDFEAILETLVVSAQGTGLQEFIGLVVFEYEQYLKCDIEDVIEEKDDRSILTMRINDLEYEVQELSDELEEAKQ